MHLRQRLRTFSNKHSARKVEMDWVVEVSGIGKANALAPSRYSDIRNAHRRRPVGLG